MLAERACQISPRYIPALIARGCAEMLSNKTTASMITFRNILSMRSSCFEAHKGRAKNEISISYILWALSFSLTEFSQIQNHIFFFLFNSVNATLFNMMQHSPTQAWWWHCYGSSATKKRWSPQKRALSSVRGKRVPSSSLRTQPVVTLKRVVNWGRGQRISIWKLCHWILRQKRLSAILLASTLSKIQNEIHSLYFNMQYFVP